MVAGLIKNAFKQYRGVNKNEALVSKLQNEVEFITFMQTSFMHLFTMRSSARIFNAFDLFKSLYQYASCE